MNLQIGAPESVSSLRPTGGRPTTLLLWLAAVAAAIVTTQYVATRLAAMLLTSAPLGPPAFVVPAHMRHIGLVATTIGACVGIVLIGRRPTGRAGVLAIAVAAVIGAAVYVTYRMPTIYLPLDLIRWWRLFGQIAELRPIWYAAVIVLGGSFAGALALLFLVTGPATPRTTSRTHGSAAWDSGRSLRGEAGVILGRVIGDRARARDRFIRYSGDGHLLTVAPTRSGKGVGAVIPNLLSYPGSVVVSDPKGENYAVTARARRASHNLVHALDPFDVVGGRDAVNPLDLIDVHRADALDDARLIADMLVLVDGPETGEAAFWYEEARALLAGLILNVAAHEPPESRNLITVRRQLTLPPDFFAELVERMAASDAADGLVARAAARLMQKAEKERSGVVSSAQSHTHFLDSPTIERVLSASTIDFAALKRQPTSVYLVLPPDRMDTYQRWLRLMIACALREITRTTGLPKHRVLFLLDEFAHLGRMRPIERDVSLVAGYGASFWLFVQSIAQLKAIYGPAWATFAANVDVFQTFGIRDWETADYVSRMTGDATVTTDSENQSRGISRGKHGSRQEGRAETRSERGRRLLLPDEVRRLPETLQVLFVRNSAPIVAAKVDYRIDRRFAEQYDRNPMFDRVGSADV